MRAFLAVELPDAVKRALESLIGRLRQSGVRASWCVPERMHLTLRFFESISDDDARGLSSLLRQEMRRLEAFNVVVSGVGAFPNLKRPSVVWAGIEPSEGPLGELQSVCERCAQGVGQAPENKRFAPHITLGRIRDPRSVNGRLNAPMEREAGFVGGEFTASGMSLFSSRLVAQGAIHTRLEEFRFT